jgi:hypothetical protein
MRQIIEICKHPTDPNLVYENYGKPCSSLERYIHACVPELGARHVTPLLIGYVNQTFTELMSIAELKKSCETIAPHVLKSVFHHSVNILDCIRNYSHPAERNFYIVGNCDLIYRSLPLLRRIYNLRLGAVNRTVDMILDVRGFRHTLVAFSSRNCLDIDLETLAVNCRQLKSLDISGSSHVTVVSCPFILIFERLEELNLCETDFLTVPGLMSILTGLVEAKVPSRASRRDVGDIVSRGRRPLIEKGSSSSSISSSTEFRAQFMKKFGCKAPIEGSVRLIAQLSNITSLDMSHVVSTSLEPLKNLKYLQKFALKHSRFSLAEEFLKERGNKLNCLNLVNVSGTDFKFISEKCQSLLCLHLCFNLWQYLTLPLEYRTEKCALQLLPAFPTVQVLQLSITDRHCAQYILTRFRNLRKLCMGFTFDDETFLHSIIQREKMKNLKELFWGDDIIVKISERCAVVKKLCLDGRTTVYNIKIGSESS